MDLPTYQKRVDTAFATWIRDGQTLNSLAPLAVLLGCRHYEIIRGRVHFRDPEQPDAQYENIVCRTLLAMLLKHEVHIDSNTVSREQAMLNGLLRNNRWRACVGTIQAAYRLAALAANCYDYPEVRWFGPIKALRSAVDRELPTMLIAWRPGVASPASKRDVAAALFGDAWTAMVLDAHPPGMMLGEVLERTRPRFLPGLVTGQIEYRELDLPSLDGETVSISGVSA